MAAEAQTSGGPRGAPGACGAHGACGSSWWRHSLCSICGPEPAPNVFLWL